MSGYGYGAILSAVGGVLQSVAAEQAGERMRQTFMDQLAREGRLSQNAYDIWQNSARGMGAEGAQQQMAQGEANRNALYDQLQGANLSANHTGTARDAAQGKASGEVRAKLGSYSDWELMQHINNIRTQNELNKISNYASGWERVFPYKMDDAQHSQDELAFFGNLVSSVGGGASSFGSLYGGEQTGKPYTQSLYSNPPSGVSGGYDYNPPSSGGGDNSFNPYSILA